MDFIKCPICGYITPGDDVRAHLTPLNLLSSDANNNVSIGKIPSLPVKGFVCGKCRYVMFFQGELNNLPTI